RMARQVIEQRDDHQHSQGEFVVIAERRNAAEVMRSARFDELQTLDDAVEAEGQATDADQSVEAHATGDQHIDKQAKNADLPELVKDDICLIGHKGQLPTNSAMNEKNHDQRCADIEAKRFVLLG